MTDFTPRWRITCPHCEATVAVSDLEDVPGETASPDWSHFRYADGRPVLTAEETVCPACGQGLGNAPLHRERWRPLDEAGGQTSGPVDMAPTAPPTP